ncbi:MAG: hypothetical protein KC535_02315 [Nanoarchaeota archaeon]|nr:hypothetical protein [Nanoarchaeota archaeon]
MKFSEEYVDRLKDYDGLGSTLHAKSQLAKKGVEFLIEGLDQDRIDDLRAQGRFNKDTRRGSLSLNGLSGISAYSALWPADSKGYKRLGKAVSSTDANVVVARTSGINFDDLHRFFIQGDLYKI